MKSIYFCESEYNLNRVYSKKVKKELFLLYGINEKVYNKKDFLKENFCDTEYLFSTWGMPILSVEEIHVYFPSLKAVFYAAGTVQTFAKPFLECGIKVFSAWKANAIPVIEYTVAQIILANKGFYLLSRIAKSNYNSAKEIFKNYKGNYGSKVGILGDGAIGSQVISRLKGYNADIYVYSITMTEKEAKQKEVHLSSLKEIFSQCDVISNHLANNVQTKGIINKELINSMKDYSTFINTGRGAQVDEIALADKLKQNYTITAVLDVLSSEPPESDNSLLQLDNVVLTPHIAGSAGQEVERMAEYMLEESKRFNEGEKTNYEITLDMLRTMA